MHLHFLIKPARISRTRFVASSHTRAHLPPNFQQDETFICTFVSGLYPIIHLGTCLPFQQRPHRRRWDDIGSAVREWTTSIHTGMFINILLTTLSSYFSWLVTCYFDESLEYGIQAVFRRFLLSYRARDLIWSRSLPLGPVKLRSIIYKYLATIIIITAVCVCGSHIAGRARMDPADH